MIPIQLSLPQAQTCWLVHSFGHSTFCYALGIISGNPVNMLRNLQFCPVQFLLFKDALLSSSPFWRDEHGLLDENVWHFPQVLRAPHPDESIIVSDCRFLVEVEELASVTWQERLCGWALAVETSKKKKNEKKIRAQMVNAHFSL